jgi:hypothetical protein
MDATVRTLRQQREARRIRRRTEAGRDEQTSAMAGALSHIGVAFDEAAVVGAFKIRVERLIRLGAEHPAVRARFRARAVRLQGRDLDAAMVMAERWWRDERKAFQLASALGCGTRLSLDVLSELRLILRLMRCKRMETEYEAALAALCNAPMSAAAE